MVFVLVFSDGEMSSFPLRSVFLRRQRAGRALGRWFRAERSHVGLSQRPHLRSTASPPPRAAENPSFLNRNVRCARSVVGNGLGLPRRSSCFNAPQRSPLGRVQTRRCRPEADQRRSRQPGPRETGKTVCIGAERWFIHPQSEDPPFTENTGRAVPATAPAEGGSPSVTRARPRPRSARTETAGLSAARPPGLVAKRRSKTLFWFQFALSAQFSRERGGRALARVQSQACA